MDVTLLALLITLPVFVTSTPHCSGSLYESTRTVTGCDNDQVSISWLCNIQYDTVKQMTLTAHRSHSIKEQMASITRDGNVTIPQQYANRLKARGTSGVSLHDTTILDSGQYVIKAEYMNGSSVCENLSLCIHVPPLILSQAVSLVVVNGNRCQSIVCGHVVFLGFPAVLFVWQTPLGSQNYTMSDGYSKVHGCPLASGTYTCQLEGPATKCLDSSYSLVASTFINSSFPSEIQSNLDGKIEETERLALVILVPMAAVLLPAMVLGIWVLRHMLLSPQYKKIHHYKWHFYRKNRSSDVEVLTEDQSESRDTPSPFPEDSMQEIEDESADEGDYQMRPMMERLSSTV